MNRKLLWFGLGAVLAGGLLFLIGSWSWVLLAKNPLHVPLAQTLPWPVACSTRGCITTWAWQCQYTATELFSQRAQREAPTPVQALTTLIRQHLAHHGQLTSPVTLAAAERYRTDILHATDETQLQAATGLTSAEYDELVVIPFLEQESLRQERKAESPEDLYKQLAAERWIAVLPWHLTWNKAEGKVIEE